MDGRRVAGPGRLPRAPALDWSAGFFAHGAHAGRRESSGSRGNHRFFLFLWRFYSVFAPLHRFFSDLVSVTVDR
jgi:hypothetical protein